METPSFPIPGDGRRSQPLRAITWTQKEHQDGVKGGNMEIGVRTFDKVKDEGENEDCDKSVPDACRRETCGEDVRNSTRTTEQSRGTEA
ncbi:hypothetical protein NDU88_003491 [Pleurodeles waltl]|uniref:Uncharacterized protein n=1 Tax=Pleurodeles waltl TaxID=8319 RepID=A0AAV7RGW3_PLEWA|nr:hypothetical protein NDU88_003491 [Pleurodeles waltl]